MKAGLALALTSASALLLSAVAVRAEEKLAIEPQAPTLQLTEPQVVAQAPSLQPTEPEVVAQAPNQQQIEAADSVAFLPLPPARPAATPRRIRIAQASAAATQRATAAAPAIARGKPEIWLSMGYGF